MAQKRTLTTEEQAQIRARIIEIERVKFPDGEINVMVNGETNEEGEPIYTVVRKRDTELR